MNDFRKIVRIGTVNLGRSFASLYCEIRYKEGRLSITGVEGPTASGNARGSCGQVVMHPWNVNKYAPGWDRAKKIQFRKVWNEWHLNDMQAGTPAQTAHVAEFRKSNPNAGYEATCESLKAAGLYEVEHEGKPYRYGSAWLRVEVPQTVLDFLQGLPDTDQRPAWV